MCDVVRKAGAEIETVQQLADELGCPCSDLVPNPRYAPEWPTEADSCLCQIDIEATLTKFGRAYTMDEWGAVL